CWRHVFLSRRRVQASSWYHCTSLNVVDARTILDRPRGTRPKAPAKVVRSSKRRRRGACPSA
ncbi:MAG: hypothetical protein AVDCRST_MAG04-1001, partial [uncultured Acetobacteraceae bacterium]